MFSGSSESEIAKQYNAFAATFSEVVRDHNKDSNSDYFSYFDTCLSGKFVLDLGCGNGYDLTQMKMRGATIFGIDASEEMCRMAQRNNPEGSIVVGLFDKIPFADNSFDLVISKWAFQTTSFIDPIYKEIARVLKANGQLIFLSGHPMRQFIEKKERGRITSRKKSLNPFFLMGKLLQENLLIR